MKDLDDSKAPLIEHLLELRTRLFYSVVAFLAAFAICFYFSSEIFAFLAQPLVSAFGPEGGKLIYTKLYEAFFVQVKVALFAACFMAFPIVATQIWLFVAPGLYANEKRAFLPFLIATPVLFLLGAALAYYLVMPTAFHFFLSFQHNLGGIEQEALPAMGDYLSLVMHFILAFGISFLLPVLLMLLERAGLVTLDQLQRGRRFAILGIFIIAAIATPPDVLSQLLLAVPLIALYESALIGIRLTHWQKQRATPEEQA